ncbi:T9SS type A sorting domain-containing protein [Hymenobacter crusticola]|uniref:Secretion system C-terminal sorting domain-containing protein n=1 Tax=Hymenobacter crusticola TaxID=1770526 RepID=A0A243WIH8_9BACT|nr:T9SS type A sorting domain-containing protein [Hymenobacter crusticola]OUJ75363.1 hypothetical protein BXP70_04940 [Hymenobacter crusticola]
MKIFTRYFLIFAFVAARLTVLAASVAPKTTQLAHAIKVQEVRATAAAPSLSIYPNPAKGMVTVSLSQRIGLGQDYKLRLSNIIGREVRTTLLRPEDNSSIAVNLSDLPAGMYFYSLLVNDKIVSTKRLVLQN